MDTFDRFVIAVMMMFILAMTYANNKELHKIEKKLGIETGTETMDTRHP